MTRQKKRMTIVGNLEIIGRAEVDWHMEYSLGVLRAGYSGRIESEDAKLVSRVIDRTGIIRSARQIKGLRLCP